MKVMKFGGTSVGKPERMQQVAQLITKDPEPKIVVLSALSGTTNALVEIGNFLAQGNREAAKQAIDKLEVHYKNFVIDLLATEEYQAKAYAIVEEHFYFLNIILKISFSEALSKDILAQGELLSTKLFSVYLQEKQIKHVFLSAFDFMTIDANEEPQVGSIKVKLTQILQQHPTETLFVTQGYICKNARGEVDNLKRGGSDYTASLIAAAVKATVCEIWTDIDGMHNNDPRVVNKTKPVEQLSFEEAAELAYFGAKILHPTCIWPAQHYNVPVKLLNTMQPEAAGTVINDVVASKGVKAVAAKDGITAIKIKSSRMLLAYGFLRKIFEVFEKYKTSIDMITTSEVAVSVTIDNDTFIREIVQDLSAFGSVETEPNQTIISIVGNEINASGQALQQLFNSTNGIPITMVSYGGSMHNISLLVPNAYKQQTLQAINAGMFGL
jgi:aspartate kinase